MDIWTDNPVGRVPDTRATRRARIRLVGPRWHCGSRGGTWTSQSVDALLTQLDTVHAAHWSGTVLPGDAPKFAEFIQRAVARGTFVSGHLDHRTAAALPALLRDSVPPVPHSGEVGELAWDVQAVTQRRAALKLLLPPLPTMSVVVVSRRRDRIMPIVRRLAAQNYESLEIVVATHGVPLPPGIADAAHPRSVVTRELDGSLQYGDALNAAFSLASGELVNKMDDDDYIGADHLWDLAAAHTYSRATLIGKTTTVVHLEALDTTVRRAFGARESFTHRVAGSTMTLAASDLKAVGGWASIPRGLDTALLNSVRHAGGTVYQPHDIGYLYVRAGASHTHTWTTDEAHFLRNIREQWIGLLHHSAFGTNTPHPGEDDR